MPPSAARPSSHAGAASTRRAARPTGGGARASSRRAPSPWGARARPATRRGPRAARFLAEQAHRPERKALRLVKGSHIVVPKLFEHEHAYIFQTPDRRIIFAIPYEGDFTLIGTTDVEHRGAIGEARIDADETR